MNITKGLIWDYSGKVVIQLSSFLVTLVLARILTPEDYGIIGLAMIFVGFGNILVDLGMSVALIQRKKIDDSLLSTVFWFNQLIACIIAITIYFSRFTISTFFEKSELPNLIAILSLLIPIRSLCIIQSVQLTRAMHFKKISFAETVAAISSGAIGILLAILGFGIYALVAQLLLQSIILNIIFWINSKWYPSIAFNLTKLKSIWHFSSRQMLLGFFNTAFNQLEVLMIGKGFSASVLGFYTRAKSLNNLIVQNSSDTLSRVLFPAFSKMQEKNLDREVLYWKAVQFATIGSICISSIMFINARFIVLFLFGDQWATSAQYFKVIVLTTFCFAISSIMIALLKGIGEIGLIFRIGMLKRVLVILPILFGYHNGIFHFLYAMILYNFLTLGINLWSISNHINISISKHMYLFIRYIVPAILLVWGISLIDFDQNYKAFFLSSSLFVTMWTILIRVLDPELYFSMKRILLKVVRK